MQVNIMKFHKSVDDTFLIFTQKSVVNKLNDI